MNRRELLASVGAVSGVGAVAGCLAEEEVQCTPREDDTTLSSLDRESSTAVTFRGAVVKLGDGVIVDDTTGIAKVTSTEEQYIEQDNLEVGTCLEGTGVPTPELTWANRLPVLTVTELQSLGQAERSVSEIDDPPKATFEVSKDTTATDCGAVVELRHVGGDSVTAENLLVARRQRDSPVTVEEAVKWFELDESVEPWHSVENGDSVTFEQAGDSVGTLAWVGDWRRQLVGWETEEC